jgi:DNA-binding MarR family transcriptional regulator
MESSARQKCNQKDFGGFRMDIDTLLARGQRSGKLKPKRLGKSATKKTTDEFDLEAERARLLALADNNSNNKSHSNLADPDVSTADTVERHVSDSDISMADTVKRHVSDSDISTADTVKRHVSDSDISTADTVKRHVSDSDISMADTVKRHVSDSDISTADTVERHVSDSDISMADTVKRHVSDSDISTADTVERHVSDSDISTADTVERHVSDSDISAADTVERHVSDSDISAADTVERHVSDSDISTADTVERHVSDSDRPSLKYDGAALLIGLRLPEYIHRALNSDLTLRELKMILHLMAYQLQYETPAEYRRDKLAEATGMHESHIPQVVKSLIQKGFISRKDAGKKGARDTLYLATEFYSRLTNLSN